MQKKFLCLCMAFFFLFGGKNIYIDAAPLPYLVDVNLTQNVVTIYGMDNNGTYTVPERAFVCSVGAGTPSGSYQISDKYEWRALFGDVYGQYATRITGHILFHSVPYERLYDKASLEYWEYNRLGESVSMGCIRLTVADAKWIYDNCPAGTTVRMVESNAPLPLQPPAPQKIDANDTVLRGWDPTDPDPNNLWNNIQQQTEEKINLRVDGAYTTVMGLQIDGNYYLSVADATAIFEQLGQKITLPVMLQEGFTNTGEVQIKKDNQIYEVAYSTLKGMPYFCLRDIAAQTDVSLSWDAEQDMIVLQALEKEKVEPVEQPKWWENLLQALGLDFILS